MLAVLSMASLSGRGVALRSIAACASSSTIARPIAILRSRSSGPFSFMLP